MITCNHHEYPVGWTGDVDRGAKMSPCHQCHQCHHVTVTSPAQPRRPVAEGRLWWMKWICKLLGACTRHQLSTALRMVPAQCLKGWNTATTMEVDGTLSNGSKRSCTILCFLKSFDTGEIVDTCQFGVCINGGYPQSSSNLMLDAD